MNFVPTRVYFASGTYNARKENKNTRDRLSAALGLSRRNICPLTSVLPPGVRVISRAEFEASTREGEVVFAVNGLCESNVPGTVVTAGMGMAFPADQSCGFITELYEEVGIAEDVMHERIEKATIQIMGDQLKGDFPADETARLWRPGQVDYAIGDFAFKVYRQVVSTVVTYEADYAAAFVIAVLLP